MCIQHTTQTHNQIDTYDEILVQPHTIIFFSHKFNEFIQS